MTAADHRPQLNILDGGRVMPVSQMDRFLLDAYVSNTRLMGVLAVGAEWEIIPAGADRSDPKNWEVLHQFFYIDCEEAGLETYQQVRLEKFDDEIEADRIRNALFCGLGGEEMPLEERELRLLLQTWARFNDEHGLPMPRGRENYGFLLEPQIEAAPEELEELMDLICVHPSRDAAVINYFLMRCFGRDYEGARYLCGSDDVPVDLYGNYVCATFYRNEITPQSETTGGVSVHRCVSLIEMDGAYENVVSLVTLRDGRVIGLQHCDRMSVTTQEAAMILMRDEYFMYYEVLMSDEDLEENIDEFTLSLHTTMSEYNNGLLFMRYRYNNDHVNSSVFLLHNDVKGMYFLTDDGQLILCAYSFRDVRDLHHDLKESLLGPYMEGDERTYRYFGFGGSTSEGRERSQSLMLDFMNSDGSLRFEDFFRPVPE